MFLEKYSASLQKAAKVRKTIWRIKRHLLRKGYEAYFDYTNFDKIEDLTQAPKRFDSPLPETQSVDISLSLLDIRSVMKAPSRRQYKDKYRILNPGREDNQRKHMLAVRNEIKGIKNLVRVEDPKEPEEDMDNSFQGIHKQKTNIQKNFVKTLITKGTIQKKSRNHNGKTLSKINPLGSSLGAKPPLNYTVLLSDKSSFHPARKTGQSQFKRYKDFTENQLLRKNHKKSLLGSQMMNTNSHQVLVKKGIRTIKHKKTLMKLWSKSGTNFSNFSFNMKDIRATSVDNLQGDKGSTRKLNNWRSYSEFKSIALQKNGKVLEGSIKAPHSKISNARSAFRKSMAKSVFSSKKNLLGGRRGVVAK